VWAALYGFSVSSKQCGLEGTLLIDHFPSFPATLINASVPKDDEKGVLWFLCPRGVFSYSFQMLAGVGSSA